MDEKDIAALQNAEIDYEDIIDRFEGNESLYLKLAELFLDDPHMPNVRRAFAAGDLATAEVEAHALKGVAGNLSLTSVHKLAKSMNDALREGNEAAATKLLPQLDEAYEKAVGALREVLGREGAKTHARNANATPNNETGRIAKATRPASLFARMQIMGSRTKHPNAITRSYRAPLSQKTVTPTRKKYDGRYRIIQIINL